MMAKEKDYAAALMEDMNHNVKAFWEVLDGVRKKGEDTLLFLICLHFNCLAEYVRGDYHGYLTKIFFPV
jgi:hypothetical protein